MQTRFFPRRVRTPIKKTAPLASCVGLHAVFPLHCSMSGVRADRGDADIRVVAYFSRFGISDTQRWRPWTPTERARLTRKATVSVRATKSSPSIKREDLDELEMSSRRKISLSE